MNANDSTLPAEFEEGPWIDAQQLMEWINIKTGTLKSWRRRGIVWYSNLGGKILYNKPWKCVPAYYMQAAEGNG